MDVKKITSIAIVFIVACIGWWILGTATSVRSYKLYCQLDSEVESLWGEPIVQKEPLFSVQIPGSDKIRRVIPTQNIIHADIKSDYRKKGLIWYATYICDYEAVYTITNTDYVDQKIYLHFDFPVKNATYDNFSVLIDDKPLRTPVDTEYGISEIFSLSPAKSVSFKIKYTTRGKDTWKYKPDPDTGRVLNLDLTVNTDFRNVDFTDDSRSPSNVTISDNGASLKWNANDLITNSNFGLVIPEKLNPGPLTSRITFFAPVCLIFFFVLISTINVMYHINIHPMHYLFVAAGFFAFHLLLTYMAGHIGIHAAFIISASTSVLLVTSYLSSALGKTFPWKVAVTGQIFYLVLFSYSFFIKGISGLTIAVGSVATLAVLMKVTAHVNWNEVFEKGSKINV